MSDIKWLKYPENRPEGSGNFLVWGYSKGVLNGQEFETEPRTHVICADKKGNFNGGNIVVIAFAQIPKYEE